MTDYCVINAAWQLGGDRRLFQRATKDVEAIVALECRTKDEKPLDVADILGPGWKVQQRLRDLQGRPSAALAGTVTAVRRHIPVRRTTLQPLSPGNSEVMARFQRLTVIRDGDWITDLMGGHNPLLSTGVQRAAVGNAVIMTKRADKRARREPAERILAGRRWARFDDCNMDPDQWAKILDARQHMGDMPMSMTFGAHWGGLEFHKRWFGGADHAILYASTS